MGKTKTNTGALVNETLAKDEVMSLLNETLGRNGKIDDYLSILKGTVTTWDGTTHDGYIVCHTHKDATHETVNDFMPTYVEHEDYYFMEVTLEEVNNPMGTSHLWEPTFHMLLPITENYKRKPVFHEGNTKELCQYIIDCACRDTWAYTEVPMSKKEIEEGKKKDWYWYHNHTTKVVPLNYNDIYCHWQTPLTTEEREQREATIKAREKALIRIFSEGELPEAESEPWYAILSMGYGTEGYDFESKVIKILKNRGFNVYIDGERDSFGWVTRGIFIDNKIMCIY